MAVKIGINGFGRIGRMVFRAAAANPNVEVVAINDLTDARSLANLLKYDSAQGVYRGDVSSSSDALVVDGVSIPVTAEREVEKLDWTTYGAQVVVEATGTMRSRKDAAQHLAVGAQSVLIAGVSPNADLVMVVGVNDQQYDPQKHRVVSLDSCVTNCLAPLCKVLNDKFGVENVFVTATHEFTHDEAYLDYRSEGSQNDKALEMMRNRTTVGNAVGTVVPQLSGKVADWFLHAPTPQSSLVDMTVLLNQETSVAEVNAAVLHAAENELRGVVEFCVDPVSTEQVADNTHSAIFDCALTAVQGRMVKLYAWYDNEWGYANRVVDMVQRMVTANSPKVAEVSTV